MNHLQARLIRVVMVAAFNQSELAARTLSAFTTCRARLLSGWLTTGEAWRVHWETETTMGAGFCRRRRTIGGTLMPTDTVSIGSSTDCGQLGR